MTGLDGRVSVIWLPPSTGLERVCNPFRNVISTYYL